VATPDAGRATTVYRLERERGRFEPLARVDAGLGGIAEAQACGDREALLLGTDGTLVHVDVRRGEVEVLLRLDADETVANDAGESAGERDERERDDGDPHGTGEGRATFWGGASMTPLGADGKEGRWLFVRGRRARLADLSARTCDVLVPPERWRVAHTCLPLADGTMLLAGGISRIDKGGVAPESYRPRSFTPSARAAAAARREPDATLDVGARVRVKDGPFTGTAGRIESLDRDAQQANVTVSVFGRDVSTTLPLADLEPLASE
jgi:hypothetical protein